MKISEMDEFTQTAALSGIARNMAMRGIAELKKALDTAESGAALMDRQNDKLIILLEIAEARIAELEAEKHELLAELARERARIEHWEN